MVSSNSLPDDGILEPSETSVRCTWPADDSIEVFAYGRESICLNCCSCESFRMVETRPDHQSLPEKLYFGQMSGTGCLRIFAAETVLVCHACSSMVSVVEWMSPG